MEVDWRGAVASTIDRWDKRLLIASNDVDGMLCAAFLSETYGARIAGFYTTRDIVLASDIGIEDAKQALWIDLDIDHPAIISVGQHVLLHDGSDTLRYRNPFGFNPNVFFRQACFANGRPASFQGRVDQTRDKYPFGTIHFLLEALQRPLVPLGPLAIPLLVHADSAWTNAATYPRNCRFWADLMFQDPASSVRRWVLPYMGFSKALARHRDLIGALGPITSSASAGSVTPSLGPAWQGLNGHQTVALTSLQTEHVRILLALIERELGWRVAAPASIGRVIRGNKRPMDPNAIPAGAFDTWLRDNEVFSHAITGLHRLLYTTGIDLDA